ncbi:aminoglycoside phosphotransferase family protein [Streptomyces calidiresistens]
MTTTASPESAARRACLAAGLPHRSLTRLHEHATTVFLLPEAATVVRVGGADQGQALERAIALTRWLCARGFPATEPADVPQPFSTGTHTVTFWKHYPQPDGPPPDAGHLGAMLRALHALPLPPVPLPEFRPLASLEQRVAAGTSLSAHHRAWLTDRIEELLVSYEQLDSPLGPGLLHGDAYPGNTLWDGSSARLGDWDEAAFGPRELDLANTYQGVRFGRTEQELERFGAGYGRDIRDWPGLPVLCRIRDLHTLGSYIRRADAGDEAASAELVRRLDSLRSCSDTEVWAPAR